MLIFTHDRVRLEEHFRRDPVMFAYHLGDLDDFLFERCQWAASYHKSTRIDECVLIYHAPFGSSVLAFGLSERFAALLEETVELFPARFFGHFFAPYRPLFERVYREEPLGTTIRMKLGPFRPQHREEEIEKMERLDGAHLPDLTRFYREAFPGSYFEDRMVETGKYFGWMDQGRIVAAAGVHVYSPRYRMAVIGNVATHPEFRGQGLATKLMSRLAGELAGEGLLVCLNVAADNAPAVRCYDKLGFTPAFSFEESRFELK